MNIINYRVHVNIFYVERHIFHKKIKTNAHIINKCSSSSRSGISQGCEIVNKHDFVATFNHFLIRK